MYVLAENNSQIGSKFFANILALLRVNHLKIAAYHKETTTKLGNSIKKFLRADIST